MTARNGGGCFNCGKPTFGRLVAARKHLLLSCGAECSAIIIARNCRMLNDDEMKAADTAVTAGAVLLSETFHQTDIAKLTPEQWAEYVGLIGMTFINEMSAV